MRYITLLATVLLLLLAYRPAFADGRLERCEPYKADVQAKLAENGLPTWLYYLMVAESGCRDEAESDKGAKGYWQLMPYTARVYGCEDPHNLECATEAAIGYLKHLSKRFSGFDLVRAYNRGGTNLQRKGTTKEAEGLVHTVRRLIKLDMGELPREER